MICATLTLFAYDYLLSFEDEITYIWSRPWRWGKVVYVWTRTITIGYIMSLLVEANCDGLTFCFSPSAKGDVTYYAIYVLMTLVYVSAQAILGARIYALYGNKRRHLICLIMLCGVMPTGVSLGVIIHGPMFFGTRDIDTLHMLVVGTQTSLTLNKTQIF